MNDSTIERPALRQPPQIIRVPPPDEDLSARLFALLTVVGCFAALCLGVLHGWWAAGAPVAVVVVLQVIRRVIHRRALRERAALLEREPEILASPAAMALSRAWGERRRTPQRSELLEILNRASPGWLEGATLVVFGSKPLPMPPDLPPDGDLRFEPRVITATDLLKRSLVWQVGAAGACIAVVWIGHLGLFPTGPLPSIASGYIGVGIIAIIVWVWRAGIRPTYVRLAPGVIQIMKYTALGGAPEIRSYPMQPGTVVVVPPERQQVILLRDDRADAVPLAERGKLRLMTILESLLSTAPIPTLSETELLE